MFGFIRSLPFSVLAQQTIEIKDACLSYTENQIEAKIRIKSVVNPSSVRDTDPFRITVLDANRLILAQTEDSGAFFVPASQFATAELVSASFEPSNPVVQEPSNLRLSFQTKNKLSSQAMIKIELPSVLELSNECSSRTITV